jgi:cardiolipin synthase A/B
MHSPWREGNRFRLLNDGVEFFPRMLATIDAARDFVLLEMYLVESGRIADRFIDALTQAAARGVRTLVMLDGFGSLRLRTADRKRLVTGDVELRVFNTLGWRKRTANLLRDHRKLLLVDGRIGYVGGAGITDNFDFPAPGRSPWREMMVEIEGPVIGDWLELFAAAWRRSGGARAPVTPRSIAPFSAGMTGRAVASAGWNRSELANSVIEQMDAAQARIRIVSAYFVPSRRFRKALRRAARRGVDVRILAPGPLTDHPIVRHAGRRFFGKLLRNGVRIFEYQPRMLHAKMVICDDWVSIGSANLDRWNFKWNLEANQEILNRSFANLAALRLERDFADSNELERRQWAQRNRVDRLFEQWAGWIDRMLERLKY